jgi:hypothetical protein
MDDEFVPLLSDIAERLSVEKMTLGVAESCTSGYVSKLVIFPAHQRRRLSFSKGFGCLVITHVGLKSKNKNSGAEILTKVISEKTYENEGNTG